MTRSEQTIRDELEKIAEERRTIVHEYGLLKAWEQALDRNERTLRRALQIMVGGTTVLVGADGRPYIPRSKQPDRDAVMEAFQRVGPALDRRISQVELERHIPSINSGRLSRAVRDLEAEGKLFHVDTTPRRSNVWSDIPPDNSRPL